MPSRPSRRHDDAPQQTTARSRWLTVPALAFAIAVPTLGPVESAQAAAVVPTPSRTLPSTVDAASPYRQQYSCDPVAKKGVEEFLRVLLKTYPMGHSGGIVRGCGIGSTSEHKEGRAIDFMLNVNVASQKAAGDALTSWLTGKDSRGVVGGNARRLGVMYVIWNRRIWGVYNTSGWRTYTGPVPHTDHVHISFGWDGAAGRTSWWDGTAVTKADQGPCPVYTGQPAPVYTTARTTACPATKTSPTSTYAVVWPGQSTSSVKVAQQKLGVTADGAFGPLTRNALFAWQRKVGLPVTGVLDKPSWAKLVPSSSTTPTPPPTLPPGAATTTSLTPYTSSTLIKGARGAAVTALQKALGITADGEFGPDTEAAVKGFQAWKGLSVTGVVDPAMWDVLEATVYPLLPYRSTVLRKGSTGSAVTALQRALRITADGDFGSGTEAAVKSAQTRARLSATGVVDTATWIAVEAAAYPLGSTVDLPALPPVPRIDGHDRYDTAAAVSERFPVGVPVAFVASGDAFADAVAGAAVAGGKRSPILLSTSRRLPASTIAALKRLKPQSIVVLGGTGTLSVAVESELKAYTTGAVTRVAGRDRYTTAAAVSQRFVPAGVDVAYVASGENFPDALAGAALAGARRRPVLLTTGGKALPASTVTELKRLKPRSIVILGGPGSVSTSVQTQLAGLTTGSVSRLGGRDRFEVAQNVANQINAGVPVAYVASGLVFPDALAGAALAARAGAPVVLVTTTGVPSATKAALTRLEPDEITVLGGPGTVAGPVASALSAFVNDN
ncbi:MAG TPA: cell wall-binding repeat-containing protein [Actinomycetales bacterium]|nr:cell wall-binding repeat-containing protein [Actinomycetales bacterium]